IVIGYADYFDVRNVAAPSRIKEMEQWTRERDPQQIGKLPKIPKTIMGPDGVLKFELAEQSCALSDCEAADPSDSYMRSVSAHLINEIVESAKATVYLLFFEGAANNPILQMIDKRVELISALPQNLPSGVRDDINGFDPHPGPYWHYAIASLLRT